jgi:hypothetical protein
MGEWRERDRSGGRDWPAHWNTPHRPPHGRHRAVVNPSEPPAGDRRHWLLVLPVVLSLATPLYNRAAPHLFGMPFFYWFQLALAAVATLVMAALHLATRKPDRGV